MRIGIDATPLPSQPVGAGTYIIQLIHALANLSTDHEFTVFAHQSGRRLIDVPTTPGWNWIDLPDKNPVRRLIWEQTSLPSLVRKSGIDLLHSLHYTRPLILPCASVVTFHDMTFFLYPDLHTRSKRIFFPYVIRMSARHANALIAVSENTRRDSIRLLGLTPERIFTVPNGVSEGFRPISDTSLLEKCRQRYGLPEEFILYVGLVEPRKNLPLLLRAYARLTGRSSLPSLVVVGRFGWMYEEVLHQVETLDLQDKIHFTGYIPAQDLPIVYNLAQVFVYPSIYEGFGFPPLEAMACGTPVIVSSTSTMPEHVGDAGILVPPQDEKALSHAMQTTLDDSVLRHHLSIKGRQQAENFTWKRTAQETLKVYQQVGATLK